MLACIVQWLAVPQCLQTTASGLGGGCISTYTDGGTLDSIQCHTSSCPRLVQLWMLRQPDAGGTFVMAGNPPNFLSDTWKGDSGGPLLVPNTTDPSRDMQARVARASWPALQPPGCGRGGRVRLVQAGLHCSCQAVAELARAATCQVVYTGIPGALMAQANQRGTPLSCPHPFTCLLPAARLHAPCSLALFPTECTASLATIPMSHCSLRGSLVASRWVGVGQNKLLRSQGRTDPLLRRAVPAVPTAPNSFQPTVTLIPLPQLLLEPNGLGAEYHIKRLPACEKTTNKYCELHAL